MTKEKILFGTKYQPRVAKHASPTGDKIQMEHTPHMGLDGRRKLIKDNPKPIYEIIQASRDECEIDRIVRRAMEGDTSVLNAIEGQYIDITGAPKSLAHAQQIIINAKMDFEKLDAETKKKFDNNVEIFIATAGSKEWCDKLGITEKLERQENARKAKAEYESNLQTAMANLAKGSKKTKTEEPDEVSE